MAGAGSAAALPPELLVADVTYESLFAFYLKHNPSRATEEDVTRVLKRYEGDYAKLLVNLRRKYNDAPELTRRSAGGSDSIAGESSGSGLAGAGAVGPSSPPASGRLDATTANAAVAAVSADSGPMASSVGAGASSARTGAAASSSRTAERTATASAGSGVATAKRVAERLRQVEERCRGHVQARDEAEAQLRVLRPEVEELESRWNEISSVCADAASQEKDTQRQVELFRRALDEKNAQIERIEAARKVLQEEAARTEARRADLEAGFQDRLQAERERKEQELLDSIASLRKAADAKDRRWKELDAEKSRLERLQASRSAGLGAGDAAMVEAHSAIAAAFAGLAREHPCIRLFDEPMLKLTTLLFRQPIIRRMFYMGCVLIWLFAVHHLVA
eukprot:TRINITY_DN6613_c1_g3_i1.p1 TRINITY_DN6613_c1_g3~~TRINITY_DN6613_c1_g3_i1.p1  ORF type:complete len:392 (+),score=96.84 TRINITY_DN6613_c1_g3_i1:55-1230(+)